MEFPMISCEVWRSFLALFKLMNDDQSVVSPMVSTVGGIWDLQQELSHQTFDKNGGKTPYSHRGVAAHLFLLGCFFLWAGL